MKIQPIHWGVRPNAYSAMPMRIVTARKPIV